MEIKPFFLLLLHLLSAAATTCSSSTSASTPSICTTAGNSTIATTTSSSMLMMSGDENDIVVAGKRRYVQEGVRATNKYITPGALKKDQPVCNGGSSGQSYSSSCLPPPSNPHTRGCSRYYRCRSDS
ncbi:Protein RALF-like 32 [Linum grandiflorum]